MVLNFDACKIRKCSHLLRSPLLTVPLRCRRIYFEVFVLRSVLFRYHEWPVSSCLAIPKEEESGNDGDSVAVVTYHGPVSSTILPTKNSIEDAPTTSAVQDRAATVNMPDASMDIIRAWSSAGFCGVAADEVVPRICFEVLDGSAAPTRYKKQALTIRKS